MRRLRSLSIHVYLAVSMAIIDGHGPCPGDPTAAVSEPESERNAAFAAFDTKGFARPTQGASGPTRRIRHDSRTLTCARNGSTRLRSSLSAG
jgi:hypothetical protein